MGHHSAQYGIRAKCQPGLWGATSLLERYMDTLSTSLIHTLKTPVIGSYYKYLYVKGLEAHPQ
jgi:hypothetical protein